MHEWNLSATSELLFIVLQIIKKWNNGRITLPVASTCLGKTHSLTRAVHSVVTTGLNAEPVISGMTWTKRWPAQVALTPVHATNKHQHQCVCVWGCLSVEIPLKGTSKASSCSQVYENITPDVMRVLSKSLSESITRSQSDTSDCPLCCSG